MLFVIYRKDKRDLRTRRAALRAAHLAYLEAFSEAILCAGALLSDVDQEAMKRQEIGSLYVVRFDSEAQARAFAMNDPFQLAGLFEAVEVTPFESRIGAFSEAKLDWLAPTQNKV